MFSSSFPHSSPFHNLHPRFVGDEVPVDVQEVLPVVAAVVFFGL